MQKQAMINNNPTTMIQIGNFFLGVSSTGDDGMCPEYAGAAGRGAAGGGPDI